MKVNPIDRWVLTELYVMKQRVEWTVVGAQGGIDSGV